MTLTPDNFSKKKLKNGCGKASSFDKRLVIYNFGTFV